MALQNGDYPPLATESEDWSRLPEAVPVLGYTNTEGFKAQNTFWVKGKVEKLGEDFKSKYLSLVSVKTLPPKVQPLVQWFEDCLILRKTVRLSVWETLSQFLGEDDAVDVYVSNLDLPEQALLAKFVQDAQVSPGLSSALQPYLRLPKKNRSEAEDHTSASQPKAGLENKSKGDGSGAGSSGSEEGVNLLASETARDDGNCEIVAAKSSEGLQLDRCSHLVISHTHRRTALRLCDQAGIDKVHQRGPEHIQELILSLDGVSCKSPMRPYNEGQPLVDGQESDHYEAIVEHVRSEATRTGRSVPGLVDISAKKTGLSVLVNTKDVPTFVSGGADLAFTTKEPTASDLQNQYMTAATADAKLTPKAKDMLSQLLLEHFGGTARSMVPHMTLGGDFATVMHMLFTRSVGVNESVSTSIDAYVGIDPATALAITVAWVSKVRRNVLPAAYVQGSNFLRAVGKGMREEELEFQRLPK